METDGGWGGEYYHYKGGLSVLLAQNEGENGLIVVGTPLRTLQGSITLRVAVGAR